MKIQKALIGLFITTSLALLMNPTQALSESNPIVLEKGFVRVEIFTEGSSSLEAGPTGLAFDDQGNLYITNEWGCSVSKVTPSGVLTTFVSELLGPSGIAFHSMERNLYISDDTAKIFKISLMGDVETFFGEWLPPRNPNAIAFDGDWNLFVVDATEGEIYKVTPEGASSIFATGFACPEAAVFDDDGNLYVSDFSSSVFKITPGGVVTVYATFPGATEGGLAFDKNGNLYVSSFREGGVYKISQDGEVNLFVTGFEVVLGQEPNNFIRGLIFDNMGNLYITEYGNNIVWRVVSVKQAIQGLIAKVRSLNLPRGLENSLVKILEATKRALDQENAVAAVRLLDAFINEVQAQKGKKIDEDNADDLIEEAEKIKDSI